jgi:hypothetical protein
VQSDAVYSETLEVSCSLFLGAVPMHMDYSGDNIMDYRLWSMLAVNDRYQEHLLIPLTMAASNITSCAPWLVWIDKNDCMLLYINFQLCIKTIFNTDCA